VRLVNDTPQPAAIHWHGVRAPSRMSGVPGLTQPPVAPGASFDYRFAVPDAGTFWYRPATSASGQRVAGPTGALIVSEPVAVEADREVVLLISKIPEAAAANHLEVHPQQRLRFRIINAMPEPLRLRLEKHRVMVMAIDGQPAEAFAARDGRITLGFGNRADLFVDTDQSAGERATIFADTVQGETPLLHLVYGDAPARTAPLSELKSLPPNPLPERMDFRGAHRADVTIDDAVPAARVEALFKVRRGRTVILALVNKTAALRTVHVHGHCVRLLDKLDDGWKPFWLDTIAMPPRETVRIAFVADNPGKWLLESQTNVSWFEVL
jgi:FtsP/CotA-like multicopper oxidase with cupredoxin domain